MYIPFPSSNQRDSSSSNESPAGTNSTWVCEEERRCFPTRHSLRKRVNSKSGSLHCCDATGRPTSPPKFQRGRAYTHRPESANSIASTQSTASRTSASLRTKSKKTHSQRSAMSIFKSLAPSPQSTPAKEFEDIEFDWGQQRRGELEKRAILLEKEYDEERKAVFQVRSDDLETEPAVSIRPELSPQELTLRYEMEEEDSIRFVYKDPIWMNSSYVSAHPKDIVPYPMSYDKVNLQTDRHSHHLVTQIFSGRPSIHDDILRKNPGTVLDVGCGDGSWIMEAAQCWRHTLFYGLDLQILHPSQTQIVAELGEQLAENIRFTYFNFINDKLPFLNEKFDMVRMANLKWAIPESKWDFVLGEVHRVLKRGGWVEIIDDDFALPMAPNCLLSGAQLAVFDKVEAYFKNMLQARNLPLNIHSRILMDKLGYHFSAYHQEEFPIAISKARPMSVGGAIQAPLPAEGMSHKMAKPMGMGYDDRYISFGSSRSRSRSGSISSGASHSTRDDVSVLSETLVDRESGDLTDGVSKQPMSQPLGLDIHPGRFIPCPPNELNAHAIRNLQSILACKEAIRANELNKSPELLGLETKDELLPEEKQRFRQLSLEWDERLQDFEDAFWEYESTMLRRLRLPYRFFDLDYDSDVNRPSFRPQRRRTRSQRGSEVNLPSPTPSTFSLIPTPVSSGANSFCFGSNMIRFLRVYSGWK